MRPRVVVLEGAKVCRAGCKCGKLAYSSKKLAKARAAHEAKACGEPIHAYHCPRGGHCWHIGHPIGWRRAQREGTAA